MKTIQKQIVLLLFLSALYSPVWGQSSGYYWGVMSLDGKEIVPPVYHSITCYVKVPGYGWGNIVQQNGGYAVTDSLFHLLTPFYKDYLIDKGFPFRFFVRSAFNKDLRPAYEQLTVELIDRYDAFRNLDPTRLIALTKRKVEGKYVFPYEYFHGLIDTLGNELLAPVYESLWEKSGFLLVKNKEKTGLIDRDGKELLPCVYDKIDQRWFLEYATVKKDEKTGLINNRGEFLIPLSSYRDINVHEGMGKYLVVSVYLPSPSNPIINYSDRSEQIKYGVIDTTGQVIHPFEYNWIGDFRGDIGIVQKDDKYAFINTDAEFITPLIYEEGSYTPLAGGWAVGIRDNRSYCIDSLGHEFFGTDEMLGIESDSLNGVYISIVTDSMTEYYYDWKGNPIELKRDIPDSLYRRRILSPETGLCGFVDGKNRLVVPCKYDLLSKFEYGLATAMKRNVQNPQYPRDYDYGLIDIHGKEIMPIKYRYIRILKGGKSLYVTNSKNKVGFFDREGKQRIPFLFTDVYPGDEELGFCMVYQGQKQGMVDIYSVKEVLPCIYDDISISNTIPDYFIITKAGKMGLADCKTGKEVIPCMYKFINTLGVNNRIEVMNDNKDGWYIMQLPAQKLLSDSSFNAVSLFEDKYIKLKKGKLYGIMDLDGNMLIPVEYDEIESYMENRILVKKSLVKNKEYVKQSHSFFSCNPNSN